MDVGHAVSGLLDNDGIDEDAQCIMLCMCVCSNIHVAKHDTHRANHGSLNHGRRQDFAWPLLGRACRNFFVAEQPQLSRRLFCYCQIHCQLLPRLYYIVIAHHGVRRNCVEHHQPAVLLLQTQATRQRQTPKVQQVDILPQ